MRLRGRKGFTLVEMLVALVLVIVLVGALAGLLTGASQVSGMLDSRSHAALENAVIASEKIARELQTSPVYPDVAFEGDAARIAFPRIETVDGQKLKDFELGQVQSVQSGVSAVCRRVEYVFDKSKGALLRRTEDGEEEEVISGLKSAIFSYAVKPSMEAPFVWVSQTPAAPEAQIGAVSLNFQFDPAHYRYAIPGFQKTVLLTRTHPTDAVESAEGQGA